MRLSSPEGDDLGVVTLPWSIVSSAGTDGRAIDVAVRGSTLRRLASQGDD